MKRTLVLIALGAYVMAVPHNTIRQKLAQSRATETPDEGGEEPTPEPTQFCDCELSGTVGSGFGDAAQGLGGKFDIARVLTSAEEDSSMPDNLFDI